MNDHESNANIVEVPNHRAQIEVALGQTAVHPESQPPTEAIVDYDGNDGINWNGQTPAQKKSAQAGFRVLHQVLAARKKR